VCELQVLQEAVRPADIRDTGPRLLFFVKITISTLIARIKRAAIQLMDADKLTAAEAA